MPHQGFGAPKDVYHGASPSLLRETDRPGDQTDQKIAGDGPVAHAAGAPVYDAVRWGRGRTLDDRDQACLIGLRMSA